MAELAADGNLAGRFSDMLLKMWHHFPLDYGDFKQTKTAISMSFSP